MPAEKAEKGMRARRVEEGVRTELASLVANEISDPKAAGTIISRVEMTSDLRTARVYVRLLEGGDVPSRRREVVEALKRAGGLLRREVTQRLSLRYAPELRFFYDEGVEKSDNIERLLAEIELERRGK
jgi:ribosome-binding factor A